MPWLYPGRVNVVDTIAVALMVLMPVLGYWWERRKRDAQLGQAVIGSLKWAITGAAVAIGIATLAGRARGLPHPYLDPLEIYVRYSMYGVGIGLCAAFGHHMSRRPRLCGLVAGIAVFSTLQYFELARAVQLAQAEPLSPPGQLAVQQSGQASMVPSAPQQSAPQQSAPQQWTPRQSVQIAAVQPARTEPPHDSDAAAAVVIPDPLPAYNAGTTRISGIVYRALANGGEPGSMPVAVGAHVFLYNPQSGLTTGVTTDSTGQFYFDVDEQTHRDGEVLICVRHGVPIATRAAKMGGAPMKFQPGLWEKRMNLDAWTRLAHMTGWSQPFPPDCVADVRADPTDAATGQTLMTLAPAPQPRAGLGDFIRAWRSRPTRTARPDSQTYAAPADREVFVRLPDETIVQLEPGAAVRFARSMSTRKERGARLEGIARLVFEPSAGAPFRLWTPAAQITLDSMATIVVVRALPDSSDVVAEQGRVWLDLLDSAGAVTGIHPMVENGTARVRTARESSQVKDPVSRMALEMKRVSIPRDRLERPPLPMMYGGSAPPPTRSAVAERAQGGDVSLAGAPGGGEDHSLDPVSAPRKDAVSDSAVGDSFTVLNLPDHSLVQLAPGAVVTHAPDMSNRSKRSLVLEGTARFIAGKAPQRLQVYTPAVRVRFDGAITQAIVRATPEATDIVVEIGQVYLEVLDPDGNPTEVNPTLYGGNHLRVRTAREFHDSHDPRENANRERERISVPRDPPGMPPVHMRGP